MSLDQGTNRILFLKGLREGVALGLHKIAVVSVSWATSGIDKMSQDRQFQKLLDAVIEGAPDLPNTDDPWDKEGLQIIMQRLKEEFFLKIQPHRNSLFIATTNPVESLLRFENALAVNGSKLYITEADRRRTGVLWTGGVLVQLADARPRRLFHGDWCEFGAGGLKVGNDEFTIHAEKIAGKPWKISSSTTNYWKSPTLARIQDWLAVERAQEATRAIPLLEPKDPAHQAARSELAEALSRLDNLSDGEAIMKCARWYWRGTNGVPTDKEKALALFKKAAQAGDPVGLYNYGVCLNAGIARATNLNEGTALLEASAKAGFPPAQYRYALLFTVEQKTNAAFSTAMAYMSNAVASGYGRQPPGVVFEDQLPNGKWFERPCPIEPAAPTPVQESVTDSQAQAVAKRKARLAADSVAWHDSFAQLQAPVATRKTPEGYSSVVEEFLSQAQKDALKEQALIFADLNDVLRRGALADATWNDIHARVEAFADAGVAEAATAIALKNLDYGNLSDQDIFRPLLGVRDLEATVKRLRLAAETGNRDAAFHLGRLALEGKLEPQSPLDNAATARKLLQTAWAGDGLSPECLSAAVVLCVLDYAESRLATVDASQRREFATSARQWAQQAEGNSVPRAHLLLGRFYAEGVGGSPAPDEGAKHLRLAASEGEKVAVPPPASASAHYGTGSITGTGDTWILEVIPPRDGNTLSYSVFAVNDVLKASITTNMSFTAGQKITLAAKAKVGEQIQISADGRRIYSVKVPSQQARPSGTIPELEHYAAKYFPGASLVPVAIPAVSPQPANQTSVLPPQQSGQQLQSKPPTRTPSRSTRRAFQ